jgi:hypothetical protein
MLKSALIAIQFALLIWLSLIVVRLENFHYATVVGMCAEVSSDEGPLSSRRHDCLHSVETRTSSLWHLYYALRGE